MKRFLTIFAIAAVLFSGCSKDDEENNQTDCEKNQTGTIQFINSKTNPYKVTVNLLYVVTLQPNQQSTQIFSVGSQSIQFEQVSGYVLYPSIYTKSIWLDACAAETVLLD